MQKDELEGYTNIFNLNSIIKHIFVVANNENCFVLMISFLVY